MISIGEELKREREFREISLREISDATKINVRMLEAIERDNFDFLPGGIFNRNFIRAYAEFIGLDPEVIIRKYLVQTGTDQELKLPPSIVVPIDRSKKKLSGTKMLLIFFVILLLLLTLFALWRFPGRFGLNRSKLSVFEVCPDLS